MILILGGTTEGRAAVATADESGQPYYYSTRGAEQDVACRHGIRISGGMDDGQMTEFCRANGIRLLVDAAHPFAVRLHHTVQACAERLGLPVVRYERHYPPRTPDIVWCDDYADAIARMQAAGIHRLLALTGVQTLATLKPFWTAHDCVFRILDREASRRIALSQGFPKDRLCFYDSGHDVPELIRRFSPDAILTKESGTTGGFAEKAAAASEAGIPLFAVKRPPLPASFVTVTGPHGLRRQIETFVPDFYPLRSGFTTGACATAAAKAALQTLLGEPPADEVTITLPDGEDMVLPVARCRHGEGYAEATVIKDAGDDPDVTNGSAVTARVAHSDHHGIRFLQGEGVGRVTLPGLGIPVGEPAINRTPREMMVRELSALYDGGLDVTLSVAGGRELALRTFNPKLGIVDGISIIGTSGIVRPFSSEAFVDAIRKEVEVAMATGVPRLVINSGAKSERHVRALYPTLPPQAFVHYGNFIGETLKTAAALHVPALTLGVMLGKAVKLAEGYLDTHSKRSAMNKTFLSALARQAGCSAAAQDTIGALTLARELWTSLNETDARLFFPTLLERCMAVCRPLVLGIPFTLLLIDEDGGTNYRLSTENQASH